MKVAAAYFPNREALGWTVGAWLTVGTTILVTTIYWLFRPLMVEGGEWFRWMGTVDQASFGYYLVGAILSYFLAFVMVTLLEYYGAIPRLLVVRLSRTRAMMMRWTPFPRWHIMRYYPGVSITLLDAKGDRTNAYFWWSVVTRQGYLPLYAERPVTHEDLNHLAAQLAPLRINLQRRERSITQ